MPVAPAYVVKYRLPPMKCSPLVIAILGLCAMACGGSKALSSGAARIREGSDLELTDCTFLRNVNGSASETDSNAETHAKNKAKEDAASIGATHIKWIVPCCTYVEAQAYKCDAPE